jgi:hypothetical protein
MNLGSFHAAVLLPVNVCCANRRNVWQRFTVCCCDNVVTWSSHDFISQNFTYLEMSVSVSDFQPKFSAIFSGDGRIDQTDAHEHSIRFTDHNLHFSSSNRYLDTS